ncbi:hypothetical protein OOK58_56925 [Streptomyces sp. NBC_01728]|uniref:hypothetical protein n=1 Tax=unclassified Streptomyces TaxID=2593676 RepID=UPI00225B119D|nr:MULTISPECIES: hypothetical protein [unclassified Streptomyces]MCX4460192.1 hypothetical protein [Streptomyces sp. NBC_01719]MCX4500477.1 hypothetical protein [Streptomyces sp. NBC_01728]
MTLCRCAPYGSALPRGVSTLTGGQARVCIGRLLPETLDGTIDPTLDLDDIAPPLPPRSRSKTSVPCRPSRVPLRTRTNCLGSADIDVPSVLAAPASGR